MVEHHFHKAVWYHAKSTILSQTLILYMNSGEKMVTDNFGRQISSLRVQVNTTCNFNCFFCHMEGTGINSSQMSVDEIISIIKIARSYGVNKVKFTGGEPTLRRDIIDIVRRTRELMDGEISMTTNGSRLPEIASDLKAAGLNRINVSLHSIDRKGFEFVTGVDFLENAIAGIRAAQLSGLTPVKVNFVALKDVNIDQIEKMIQLSAAENFTLQIIEYEVPRELESSDDYKKYHFPLNSIEEDLAARSVLVDHNSLHDRPLFHIPVEGNEALVEIVRPMRNHHFCDNCTRLRVTSTGQLKPCLMRDDNYTEILRPIRAGSKEEATRAFVDAVKNREPYWKKEDTLESEVLCQIPRTHGQRV